MCKHNNIIVISIFFILVLFSFGFCEESVTITTYYPSPYGSYNELYVVGNVGIGKTTPQEKLDISGAIRFGDTSSSCNSNKRGAMKFVSSAAGVSDELRQCMKKSDDTYDWIRVAPASSGALNNGAGGSYTCSGCNNQQHALAACESKYGASNCATGSCGNFYYYYKATDLSCNCSKAIDAYEWIYNNTGYTGVGSDYGGQLTDVSGDSLFVRRKNTGTCDANSWILTLKDLGTALAP